MKTQSTIFPCPDEKLSVNVSETQSFWVRFIEDGVAVIRLMQNPVSVRTAEGDMLYEYDELEIKVLEKNLDVLKKNFGEVWVKYKLSNEAVYNPLKKMDARLQKAGISDSLIDAKVP
jgi:hypothetical protein